VLKRRIPLDADQEGEDEGGTLTGARMSVIFRPAITIQEGVATMIISFQGKFPKLDPTVFVAENATIIGDVEINSGANVWFQSVIRGDVNSIRVGSNSTIQDGCVLHPQRDRYPLLIGDNVVLGHRAVAHGCRIGSGALIGIGAIVLNGAEVGEESIVGAGSVVTPNTVVPPRTLALGIPARPIRSLDEKDLSMIRRTVMNYQSLKVIYEGKNKG
jgi:carbonic anhydrase/acetyltransferase-like protein (isoleucine patch superfamily)